MPIQVVSSWSLVTSKCISSIEISIIWCWRLREQQFLCYENEWHNLSLHCLLSLNYLFLLHLSQQKGSMESSQLPHNSNFYYCFKLYSDQSRKSAHLAKYLQSVHNFEKQTANCSEHCLSSHLDPGRRANQALNQTVKNSETFWW